MNRHLRIVGAVFILLSLAAGSGRTAEDGDLHKVIAEAIKAKGGPENLDKYPADQVKMKGTVHVASMDIEFTGSVDTEQPSRLRTVIAVEVMGMKFKHIEVLNGDRGWVSENGEVKAMDKKQLSSAREEMYLRSLTHLTVLRKKDYKLSPLGETRVGDKKAIGIRVEHRGQPAVNLFFDAKTHLLVKSEHRTTNPMNNEEYTDTRLYDKFKKVEGIQVPHKIIIKHDDKPFVESEVTEVKLTRSLPADLFGKP